MIRKIRIRIESFVCRILFYSSITVVRYHCFYYHISIGKFTYFLFYVGIYNHV